MCHNLYAVDVVSHLHFTTNKEPRRLFSAVSVSPFCGLFCYSPFPFVHGRGKRKSALQRDIEQLREFLARKQKYEGYNETFRGRNSFSKTDPDATFMHMKEDHMRNAQLKPGYNVQFGVEGEYITGVLVSSERSDQLTLIPLMEKMQGYGADYKDVTADAGYESEENYSWFEVEQKSCYIKPQNYERSKTKKFKSNMALRDNMAYDAQKDEYTCQAGQKLRAKYVGKRKSKSGKADLKVRLPITNVMIALPVHTRKPVPARKATVRSTSPRNSFNNALLLWCALPVNRESCCV